MTITFKKWWIFLYLWTVTKLCGLSDFMVILLSKLTLLVWLLKNSIKHKGKFQEEHIKLQKSFLKSFLHILGNFCNFPAKSRSKQKIWWLYTRKFELPLSLMILYCCIEVTRRLHRVRLLVQKPLWIWVSTWKNHFLLSREIDRHTQHFSANFVDDDFCLLFNLTHPFHEEY